MFRDEKRIRCKCKLEKHYKNQQAGKGREVEQLCFESRAPLKPAITSLKKANYSGCRCSALPGHYKGSLMLKLPGDAPERQILPPLLSAGQTGLAEHFKQHTAHGEETEVLKAATMFSKHIEV